MMVLKRIDVLSAGKVSGVIYAGIGLIVGAFFSLFSLVGLAAVGDDNGAYALLMGIGAVIFMPIFYGVVGFIGGVVGAVIYNIAASVLGGIELELQAKK